MIPAGSAIRRGLEDEARAKGSKYPDSYAFGALSFLAAQLYDRGEAARCLAVEQLRELEAAGRAALESEAGQ